MMRDSNEHLCKDCTADERQKRVDALLLELKEEREKSWWTNGGSGVSDEKRIDALIKMLIALGEYPKETIRGNPNAVRQMVSGWGAYWHKWKDPLSCPHCDADLRDHETGPPFKREIQTSSGFICPDCKEVIAR